MNFKIFDTHTHAFPDKIAENAIKSISQSADVSFYHNGTFDSLFEYEKQCDGFLLLPIATKPSQTRAVNIWAAEKQGGSVYSFGSIHPENENIDELLDEIVSLGLKGIKMHPEYQEFFVDDPKMFEIYEKSFSRNLIIYFHAGVDLSYQPPIRGDAEKIAKISKMFQNGRFVAAHMGGFQQFDSVCKHLAGLENVWFDTSFAAERMNPQDVLYLIRLHGTKRVLFASDAPWADFETAKNAVLNCGLTEHELCDVFYNNAIDLLT